MAIHDYYTARIILCYFYSSKVIDELKTFAKNLINSSVTLGTKDYYVLMIFFDFLCLVTIVIGVNSFGVSMNCGYCMENGKSAKR